MYNKKNGQTPREKLGIGNANQDSVFLVMKKLLTPIVNKNGKPFPKIIIQTAIASLQNETGGNPLCFDPNQNPKIEDDSFLDEIASAIKNCIDTLKKQNHTVTQDELIDAMNKLPPCICIKGSD